MSDTTHPSIETTKTKDIGNGPEQMGQLATTIINALKVQGLTEESGRKRPITVELKRGIVIKGVDNKVCIGDARPLVDLSYYEDGITIRSASTVSGRTHSVGTCLSLLYTFTADSILPSHGYIY